MINNYLALLYLKCLLGVGGFVVIMVIAALVWARSSCNFEISNVGDEQ